MDTLRIRFLLFDGFSNMVLACLMEPLRAARDRVGGPIEWVVTTPRDRPVKSSSGLQIAPQVEIASAWKTDLLVVVSGYGYRQHASRSTSRQLRSLAKGADRVLGADTAAWLLAEAGLLDGSSATVHWQVLSDFAETFLDVSASTDSYVRAGKIWTCGGASSALRLILNVIDERFGPAVAFDVSAMFIHDAEDNHSERQVTARLSGTGSETLRRVLSRMVGAIERPLALSELAQDVQLSQRSLNRVFLQELGLSPGRYYQSLRLSRARDLALNTDLNQQEIALRCGFAGAPSLNRAYSAHFGQTIGALRQNRSRHRD